MGVKTLTEFADTDGMLIHLLVKERAKYRRRNHSDKVNKLDKSLDLEELSTRKLLSRMMPPRKTWVRPSNRIKLANGAVDTSKNAEKALILTIKRDRKKQKLGEHFDYLEILDGFINQIKKRITDKQLRFESPHLTPIFKDKKQLDDGTLKVTCRPLSVYTKLEDKIILALTYRYLARFFNRYLHENILSYRPARDFHEKKHYVTDFSDGAELILDFLKKHFSDNIYAADCDIKKFYDIIPHQTVRDCFRRMLDRSPLSDEGKDQIMLVLEAYLTSFNFYDNVLKEATANPNIFYKMRKKFHDNENKNTYLIGNVEDISDEEYRQRGVPQGGALSLMVANIVLNDVDQAIVSTYDENRLFIRYCDDMIMMHTDRDECARLMKQYTESLSDHDLYFHDFESAGDSKKKSDKYNNVVATTNHFWKIKSHRPFLWGRGDGDSNLYVGFLGYEIRRDGRIRLRKSNIENYKEKFCRLKYALRRFKKKHNNQQNAAEKFETHLNKTLDSTIKGLCFYTAINLDEFKKGSQYKYIMKLQSQTRRSVDKYKIDIIKQTHQ